MKRGFQRLFFHIEFQGLAKDTNFVHPDSLFPLDFPQQRLWDAQWECVKKTEMLFLLFDPQSTLHCKPQTRRLLLGLLT